MNHERDGSRRSADAFRLLNQPLRRRLLLELSHREDPVPVETLATAVARTDTVGAATFPVDVTDADAVATELHHQHLPRLVEIGWIEYDRAEGEVRYGDRLEAIRTSLRTMASDLDVLRSAFEEADVDQNSPSTGGQP